MTEKLFVYGSLKDPEVQQLFIGRIIKGMPSSISGYKLAKIIFGKESFPVLIPAPQSKQIFDGLVLEITNDELLKLDEYEGEEYKRIETILADKTKAWIYISAE